MSIFSYCQVIWADPVGHTDYYLNDKTEFWFHDIIIRCVWDSYGNCLYFASFLLNLYWVIRPNFLTENQGRMMTIMSLMRYNHFEQNLFSTRIENLTWAFWSFPPSLTITLEIHAYLSFIFWNIYTKYYLLLDHSNFLCSFSFLSARDNFKIWAINLLLSIASVSSKAYFILFF